MCVLGAQTGEQSAKGLEAGAQEQPGTKAFDAPARTDRRGARWISSQTVALHFVLKIYCSSLKRQEHLLQGVGDGRAS